MIKFYSNENFPIALVNCLRNFGYDILTSYSAGKANQGIDDENVLNFAHQNQRVIITLNREDFISLHKQNISHSGIIICKEDPDYQGQAHLIHQFILNDNKPLIQRLNRIKKRNQKDSSVQSFVIQEY